ncbi:putative mitochondrial protein, partial [Mucuna pruriens]
MKIDNSAKGLNVMRDQSEKPNFKGNKHKLKSKNQSQSNFKSFHYHKKRHLKENYHKRRNKESKKTQELCDAVIVIEGYNYAKVLVVSNTEIEKDWVMDSGCTYHICLRKDYFESINLNEAGVVLLGNNKSCKASFSINIEHGFMNISNDDKVVSKGTKRNGLYILNGSTVIAQLVKTSIDKTRLWHIRQRHVSEKNLLELAKQNLLNGEKIKKLELWDHCILGKT